MDKKQQIKSRISALRDHMAIAGGDLCLITDNDPHISEYTGEHYKLREFFSGFTGSAGTLVVGLNEAWLFTDGRYFVQAEKELAGTGISLMKSGTKGVPTPLEHIKRLCDDIAGKESRKTVVLADGTLLKAVDGIELAGYKNTELKDDFDIAGDIWTDRPAKAGCEIYPLDISYAGESAESKISRVRERLNKEGCHSAIIASLEDIAWILNLRGSDIPCTPVFEAFLIIGEESVLFVNESSLSENAVKSLAVAKVSTQSYDSIYDCISRGDFFGNGKVLIDKQKVNYRIISLIPDGLVKFAPNPSTLMRAVKNDTQIKHLREVHKDDGLCVTRLMYKVKAYASKSGVTDEQISSEALAAAFLDNLRARIPDYVSLSFPTISAFGANAAMMHYSCDENEPARIKPGAMLLVDSGGQYLRGTTDVTRTFAVGEVSIDFKRAYTLTLKGVLALSDAVFLKGTSGYGLDILARQFLWREGIDYRCGTGHGVGYFLNVHEGPNAFRYKYIPGVSEYCEIAPGMVTTDEPGVYEEGRFGLRIENELLCVNAFENEYGEFLKFETLTLVPYDKDLILAELLTEHEKELINEYHRKVYDVHAKHLSGAELEFLKEYTSRL